MGLLKRLLGSRAPAVPAPPPSPTAGLTVFEKQYMVWAQQAVQKAGIPARPTGEFSLRVGARVQDLPLRKYYDLDRTREGVDAVLAEARRLVDGAAGTTCDAHEGDH